MDGDNDETLPQDEGKGNNEYNSKRDDITLTHKEAKTMKGLHMMEERSTERVQE